MNITWSEFVRGLSDNQSEIAAEAETSQSTVSRWIKGSVVPDARTVIRLARAYGVNPISALAIAGYITEEELGAHTALPRVWSIRDFTDLELAVETLRRVEQGSPVLEAPMDDRHPAMQGNVKKFPSNVGGFVDDALHGLDTAAGTDETQAEDE